jgi:hypothetical protein
MPLTNGPRAHTVHEDGVNFTMLAPDGSPVPYHVELRAMLWLAAWVPVFAARRPDIESVENHKYDCGQLKPWHPDRRYEGPRRWSVAPQLYASEREVHDRKDVEGELRAQVRQVVERQKRGEEKTSAADNPLMTPSSSQTRIGAWSKVPIVVCKRHSGRVSEAVLANRSPYLLHSDSVCGMPDCANAPPDNICRDKACLRAQGPKSYATP